MDKRVCVFHGFKAAEQSDRRFYQTLTPEQRLEILLELIQQGQPDETEQRFARVYRITQFEGR